MIEKMEMERDFIGYGQKGAKIIWPNRAKIAVSFVINYEEGSEQNLLDGDLASEHYLTDLPGSLPLQNARNLSVESLFEYGSRCGIWRLMDLFDQMKIPLTFFATGQALERNPELCRALKESLHEIAGHGYRWINYRNVDADLEFLHINKTLEIIQSLTGKEVWGWYTGRRSKTTRELIVKAGLKYDSDSYADELPYWVKIKGTQHLVIPYQLDTNDFRYSTTPGWATGRDFFNYLKDSFDYLYQEGGHHPKILNVGLHARLSGRPGRCEGLKRFIEYALTHEDVWICRRQDIAKHWTLNYPPEQ